MGHQAKHRDGLRLALPLPYVRTTARGPLFVYILSSFILFESMARINPNFARSTESPMDFEYDKGHGPTSEGSPFPKGPQDGEPYKDGFAGQKRQSIPVFSPDDP